MLASSPEDFHGSANLTPLSVAGFMDDYDDVFKQTGLSFDCTSYGIQTRLPVVPVSSPIPHGPTHAALLACQTPSGGLVALLLRKRPERSPDSFFIGPSMSAALTHGPVERRGLDWPRATLLSEVQIGSMRANFVVLKNLRAGWRSSGGMVCTVFPSLYLSLSISLTTS